MTQERTLICFKQIDVLVYRLLLLEVDGSCPLCGNSLITSKGKKTKLYQIAHIYPNSPTVGEKQILDNVIIFGENSESFQNKIAVCLNCHKNYDFHKNRDEYNKVLKIKKEIYTKQNSKNVLSNIDLDDEIKNVMNKIATIAHENNNIKLEMTALKTSQKFTENESLLKKKVDNYVLDYFVRIREYFKDYSDAKKIIFTSVAITIKNAYQNIIDLGQSQEQEFNNLVDWILKKTSTNNRTVCEIFVSYFIQDCEVFDEFTK